MEVRNDGQIADSRQSVRGYILTYSRIWKEKIWELWVIERVDVNFSVHSTRYSEYLGYKTEWVSSPSDEDDQRVGT